MNRLLDAVRNGLSPDPSVMQVRWLFLRGLAIVVFLAFFSLHLQIIGLIGSDGILSIADRMNNVSVDSSFMGFLKAPTIVWWFRSDWALRGLTWLGMIGSGLLLFDVIPKLMVAMLWLLYLSLLLAGSPFLSYQWDLLITETLFLSVFLAPGTVLPGAKRAPPSRISVLLLQVLLFKLMFLGGAAKLSSGDPTWWNGTALAYHFETQPLPTPLAWFMDKLPMMVLGIGVLFMFLSELIAPWFVLVRSKISRWATGLIVSLQLLIMMTGNYGTFNLLSIWLCLMVFQDRSLPQAKPSRSFSAETLGLSSTRISQGRWRFWTETPLLVVVLIFNVTIVFSQFGLNLRPGPIEDVWQGIRQFRSINTYGLFADMTTRRPEIIIQGSRDGTNWKSYHFSYKPGPLREAPNYVSPHMPRLDWQMWFAALKSPNQVPWFWSFLEGILKGSDPVISLMQRNPFGEEPPRYVRALIYRYEFSGWKSLWEEGRWWRRTDRRLYFPPRTLRNGRLEKVR